MSQDQSKEKWALVPGYEGRYEVSSFGRVRSLDRIVIDECGRTRHLKGKELSSSLSSGYPSVRIGGESVRVHRLVASDFCSRDPGKNFVDHIDGDKTNNHFENLEWVTQAENNARAYETGLKKKPFGNRCRALFNDEQVREIRADSRPTSEISSCYGVTNECIRNIKRRKTYKEVV